MRITFIVFAAGRLGVSEKIIKTGYAVDSTVYKMLDHAGRAQTLAAPQSQQNEIFVEI